MPCVGALAKLGQEKISFVMPAYLSIRLSVRPSVCMSSWKNSAPNGRIFVKFWIFRKSDKKFQVLFKFDKNSGYFTGGTCVYLWHLPKLLLEWKMFRKNVAKKMKKLFIFKICIYLWHLPKLFLEWKMFRKNVAKKMKKLFTFNICIYLWHLRKLFLEWKTLQKKRKTFYI